MVLRVLHAGRKHATRLDMEESLTTIHCSTACFCQVEDPLAGLPTPSEAYLWPREVVTVGLLHALTGVGNRALYRWLTRDYRALFPQLPERTRLLRLFQTRQAWAEVFVAAPTVLGVIDTDGMKRIHPMREGRSPQQSGRTGRSYHRWRVGGTWCLRGVRVVHMPLPSWRPCIRSLLIMTVCQRC